MKVKVKKLDKRAIIPSFAHQGDAGLDLTAISIDITPSYIEYDTGLSFELPKNHVGLIFPRSSITNKDLMLKNSIGVVDQNFRGSVKLRFLEVSLVSSNFYKVGDKIGQLIIIPYPQIELEEVEELSSTDRGALGFGSSGN